MFNTIEKLQQKPVHVRKQIALFIAGLIAFIISAMWVGTFDRRLPTAPVEANITTENNLAPLTLLKDQFGQIQSLFSQ